LPALYHSLKLIVDGLAGEQWALERAKLNSEGFRETFSEERQKEPKRAKMRRREEPSDRLRTHPPGRMLGEAASVHGTGTQRGEDCVDERWGSVPCHSLQNDRNNDRSGCDSGGRVKTWRMIAMEKLVPIGPRSCMEISASRRVTLFNRTMVLAENGMATETLAERVN
jgi:hypothetical protein